MTWGPDLFHGTALLGMRMTGLMLTAPMFSARLLPGRVRTAALVVMTVALIPAALATAVTAPRVSPETILSEGLVGVVLGLGATVFVAAAESAGDLLAVQMGLSAGNVLDPLSNTQMPVIGQFLGLFVLAMILAVGGHVVILGALSRSLELMPVGGVLDYRAGFLEAMTFGTHMFLLGLRFAAPVVAAMMIGNAAMGIVARTVPQLNVLMVAFPVQIAIGLFMLAATLPVMATFFSGWNDGYVDLVSGVLERLAGSGGGR